MFSNEFVAGMTTPHRSRILGDLGENAPEHWEWGGPATPQIDVALLLYARDDAGLRAARGGADRAGSAAGGLALCAGSGRRDLDGFEPFGFRDGISQPLVEGLGKTGAARATRCAPASSCSATANEYGLYTTDRCSTPRADPGRILPPTPEGSGRADLGRNGSYLVFRQLQQDVPGFWRFVDEATAPRDGSSDPDARLRLAAKMVGRWPSGAPLVLAPDADDPSLADGERLRLPRADDPRGARCPVGSHIRRAQPARLARPAARHRTTRGRSTAATGILRRGREYGHAADARGGARGRRRRPSAASTSSA